MDSCRKDDVDKHIVHRAKMLLDSIENATGKSISGRESEDVKMCIRDRLYTPCRRA